MSVPSPFSAVRRRIVAVGVIAVALVMVHDAAIAQDWTRFRGPNGTGESEATKIPSTWTDADYNWKVTLPGIGHSSPVIWADRIFLTSAADEGRTRFLLCLSTHDGKPVWQHEFAADNYHIHKQNSFATSTPTVDAERVYTLVVSPEHYRVVALTHDGQEVWQVDLGPFESQHGFGASPIVYEDKLIVCNENDGASFLVALDCRDGHEVWRTPRRTATVAYSTPCIYRPASGPPQLICNSEAHGISSIDPDTGKANWELGVFDKRSVSSPLIVGDLLFGSCGSGGGGNYVVAVKPGAAPEEAYRFTKQAPYVPTSVARGNLLFLWGDNGIVSCIDAETGKLHWQKRVGGNFSGSPIRVADKIFCVSVEGDVVVLAANDEYEPLSRIPLGDVCRSTPAVAAGTLYLRTETQLFSLGEKH